MKSDIKRIAKDFDFKYNSQWFHFIWISKRNARFLEYTGMLQDTLYNKFGKIIEDRIKNIEKYEKSKEFKKIANEFSGQAITKKEVLKGIKDCKKIRNQRLKKELINLHKKIKKNLKDDVLVLLTKTNNKKQKEILLNSYLLHEWIHILLIKNKVYFKSISERHWKYDEGLVTYLEYYINNRLNYLKFIKNRIKYSYQKIYFVYAIRFKKLFKNKNNSKKRKETIIKLLKSLKQKHQNK